MGCAHFLGNSYATYTAAGRKYRALRPVESVSAIIVGLPFSSAMKSAAYVTPPTSILIAGVSPSAAA